MNTKRFLIWISLLCLSFGLHYFGQNLIYAQEETEEPIRLEEIAVTATRVEKDIFRTPNSISIIDRRQIERINAPITPRILRGTVGVFAQQTTVGQGSPFLRGLTSYHTYMQIDGVRLNNSTFRSGPNQYFATISPDTIDRIEVMRGPASALYGSGAMGGVLSVFTKDPIFDEATQDWKFRTYAFGRYASATQERTGRLEVMGSRNRLGFAVGASARQFGNLNPGKGFDLHYKSRKFQIVTERPKDVPLMDEPPREVPEKWLIDTEGPLDWGALDADAKIVYRPNDRSAFKFAYQLWRQPKTPRYDKFAPRQYDEFFFAPQNRDLVYATYLTKQIGPAIDEFRVTTSFHRQKEGRWEVKHGKTERRERFDTTNTFGVSAQAVTTTLPRQRVVVGSDFYFDFVNSRTVKTDLNTGAKKIDETWGRFPDGSQFWDVNLFVQDEIKPLDRVELTLGGRFTLFHTTADLSARDKSFGVFSDTDRALTGNAGITLGLTDGLNLIGYAATSFRAPSLNDTTAVEVTNEGIDAPSPDLRPEKAWSVEGGLKARYPHFSGSVTYFFSRITDLVTRVPLEEAYEGQPIPKLYKDIQAANPGIDVFTKDNVDKTQIQGIELTGLVPIRSGWSVYGNGTFMRGKVLVLKGKEPDPKKPWEERIRREFPLSGIIGVRWEKPANRFWGEFFARSAVRQDRLSRGDIRDPRIQGKTRDPKKVKFDADGRAIDAGTPGWYTLNLRGGVRLTDFNRLTVALENLLDKRYREHGSGINSPGLNLIISLDNRF